VARAIEKRLSRVAATPTSSLETRRKTLHEFFDLAARWPVQDTRSIDEIIGYGPDGLPS
jgi:hypothetical protein